jgi:hypothetical protein
LYTIRQFYWKRYKINNILYIICRHKYIHGIGCSKMKLSLGVFDEKLPLEWLKQLVGFNKTARKLSLLNPSNVAVHTKFYVRAAKNLIKQMLYVHSIKTTFSLIFVCRASFLFAVISVRNILTTFHLFRTEKCWY